MNAIPDRAVTAGELREYIRRDRLELYIIVHLADGLRPKAVMSNHGQHARLNWLKDRVKDGRLPALLQNEVVNMFASVTYPDLAKVVDEDAPEPLIAFLPKWAAGHKPAAEHAESLSNGGVRPLRDEMEQWYKTRLADHQEREGRLPKIEEDELAFKEKFPNEKRDVLRNLRKLRPEEARKGGAPKKRNLAGQPGAK
jgi:hypothetical protein